MGEMHYSKPGAGDRFPPTRLSAIVSARAEDPDERQRAFETIISAYWKPVYKYIRLKWYRTGEDAQDLTQSFFAQAIEKRFFDSYDPSKSRFRTFVRICLDGFLANEDKAAKRIKRGGNVQTLSLDFEAAEGELRATREPAAPVGEDFFDREWTRSLFSLALDSFRKKCEQSGKQIQFNMFERYYLSEDDSKPGYQRLSSEFEVPTTSVTNYLAFGRREFRKALLEHLQELTSTDEEFRREARSLLGQEP